MTFADRDGTCNEGAADRFPALSQTTASTTTSSALGAVLFPLVEEIRLAGAEVDDLGATVTLRGSEMSICSEK